MSMTTTDVETVHVSEVWDSVLGGWLTVHEHDSVEAASQLVAAMMLAEDRGDVPDVWEARPYRIVTTTTTTIGRNHD